MVGIAQSVRALRCDHAKVRPVAMSKEKKRVYMAQWRTRRRIEVVDLAGGKCCKCGSRDQLEFDHRDREQKDRDRSRHWVYRPWPEMLLEFAKCDLLCHPCHREKTISFGEQGGGQNRIQDPRHGTAHMYRDCGCRCRDCTYAQHQYRQRLVRHSELVVAPSDWIQRRRSR